MLQPFKHPDGDPAALRVEWSRGDFKPSVPWHDVRGNSQSVIGSRAAPKELPGSLKSALTALGLDDEAARTPGASPSSRPASPSRGIAGGSGTHSRARLGHFSASGSQLASSGRAALQPLGLSLSAVPTPQGSPQTLPTHGSAGPPDDIGFGSSARVPAGLFASAATTPAAASAAIGGVAERGSGGSGGKKGPGLAFHDGRSAVALAHARGGALFSASAPASPLPVRPVAFDGGGGGPSGTGGLVPAPAAAVLREAQPHGAAHAPNSGPRAGLLHLGGQGSMSARPSPASSPAGLSATALAATAFSSAGSGSRAQAAPDAARILAIGSERTTTDNEAILLVESLPPPLPVATDGSLITPLPSPGAASISLDADSDVLGQSLPVLRSRLPSGDPGDALDDHRASPHALPAPVAVAASPSPPGWGTALASISSLPQQAAGALAGPGAGAAGTTGPAQLAPPSVRASPVRETLARARREERERFAAFAVAALGGPGAPGATPEAIASMMASMTREERSHMPFHGAYASSLAGAAGAAAGAAGGNVPAGSVVADAGAPFVVAGTGGSGLAGGGPGSSFARPGLSLSSIGHRGGGAFSSQSAPASPIHTAGAAAVGGFGASASAFGSTAAAASVSAVAGLSSAAHPAPWRRLPESSSGMHLFSRPAPPGPITEVELKARRRALSPDRNRYNPRNDGRAAWKDVQATPFRAFQEPLSQASFVRAATRLDEDERAARFVAARSGLDSAAASASGSTTLAALCSAGGGAAATAAGSGVHMHTSRF